MSITFPAEAINQYINKMYNRNNTLDETYAINTSFTGIPSYNSGTLKSADFGVAANAQGSQSVAFGTYSMASMTNATAIGFRARGEQTNATAVGEEALVRAFGGTAIGRIANVLGIRGTAIGNAAYIAAGATNGIAIGASARSYSPNSVTIGYLTSSGTGSGNVLIGQGSSIADGLNNCTVVGQGTTVTVGSNQTAMGQGITASADNTTAVGQGVSAIGTSATMIGWHATSGTGLSNTAIGREASTATLNDEGNTAVGAFTFALTYSVSIGSGALSVANAVAVGFDSQSENSSVAIGQDALADHNGVAIGRNTLAYTGTGNTAVGYSSNITGSRSSCLGSSNTITHDDVIVFGNSITSTANGQVVFGSATTVFTNMYIGRGITHTGAAQNTKINVTGGTGSNVAGDHMLLIGGAGTGTGAGGDVIIQTCPAGASSSSQNAAVQRLKVAQMGDVIVGSGAIATNATDGFFIIESTAGTPSGTPSNGNGAMVYDSTNSILYVYNGGWQKVSGSVARASGRSTAQTALVASVATYTAGAADASFTVSANVNVTTSTLHSFGVTVAYTDETNTGRTLTLPMVQLAGTLVTAITNATGAGPYEGFPVHIRCKASTAITVATAGTFTTVTYNVEARIQEV